MGALPGPPGRNARAPPSRSQPEVLQRGAPATIFEFRQIACTSRGWRLRRRFFPHPALPAVEWRVAPGVTAYADAVTEMEARATAIAEGRAAERVWLVEHPALYTAGTSARDGDLLDAHFPVHRTGRGGQFTYHGPGQRVAYVMLDLRRRRPDVRAFVGALERWLIDTLAEFGVLGETREDRRRRLGRPARQAGGARRRRRRRQDRRARHSRPPLGFLPRRGRQRRTRSLAFPRYRALRNRRGASRRDEPQRPRIERDDGGGGCGATRGIRGAVRGDGIARTCPLSRPCGRGLG